jgi:hypothetical protein
VSHWFFYLAAYGITRLSEVPEAFETASGMFLRPLAAVEGIKLMNGAGWPVPGVSSNGAGITVRGLALGGVWAAEAVWIGYFSLAAPVRQAGAPYSERRGMWMDTVDLPKPIAFIENAAAFREALSLGDYGALMTPAAADGAKYAVVTMYPDSWDPYVSVSNVTVKGKGKKRGMSVKTVVKYLKVPAGISLEIKDALS